MLWLAEHRPYGRAEDEEEEAEYDRGHCEKGLSPEVVDEGDDGQATYQRRIDHNSSVLDVFGVDHLVYCRTRFGWVRSKVIMSRECL